MDLRINIKHKHNFFLNQAANGSAVTMTATEELYENYVTNDWYVEDTVCQGRIDFHSWGRTGSH